MNFCFSKRSSFYKSFRFVLLPAAAVVLATAIGCGNHSTVSQELMGIWTTKEKLYEDCYIEINDEMVVFGTGGEAPNMFFINTVREKGENGIREYELLCQNIEETDFSIVFHVEDKNGQLAMRLKNPNQVVWEKRTVSDNNV